MNIEDRYRYGQGYSDYLVSTFTRHLDPARIRLVFEIGSRDGADAVLLSRTLDAQVHTFECNPLVLEMCRKNLAGHERVTLVERAAWKENGPIRFYPVVETRIAGVPTPVRVGASSCFRAKDDYLEQYVQSDCFVEAVRIDDYCRQNNLAAPDLICMDVQGAALQVLQGMGKLLGSVRYIITELERKAIYHGQSLYTEVDLFLKRQGFRRVVEVPRDGWFSDFMYCRFS